MDVEATKQLLHEVKQSLNKVSEKKKDTNFLVHRIRSGNVRVSGSDLIP
jgi:hypothetical protein